MTVPVTTSPAMHCDYYLAPASPWAYLGHAAFVALARRHRVPVAIKPIDLGGTVFPASGGVPVPQRPPQRQAYRLVELERWARHRGLPLNLRPRFFPVDNVPASRWILAADAVHGTDLALAFAGEVLKACWAEDADISDPATLQARAARCGADAAALAQRAATPEIAERFRALTEEALAAQVFGAPWYVWHGEPFWGQDRLDFLERAFVARPAV